jgi:IS30 family transposase
MGHGDYEKLTPQAIDELWVRLRAGKAAKPIARELGLCTGTVRAYLLRCGGIRPDPRRRAAGRLTMAEREEVSRGLAAGHSLRAIAMVLGRAPSTVSREVAVNRGPRRYRAARADRAAWTRAARPKACKLATLPGLRDKVEEKLQRRWSPQQIAGWLTLTLPTSPEMRVSHETIYRTLFVQSRGALRRELTRYLRTGRVIRRPKGVRMPDGRSGRPNILHISEGPPEAEDRAVPGHWEGDLIYGKAMSPIATLVERSTRFLILLRLPRGNHQADVVADALADAAEASRSACSTTTTLPRPARLQATAVAKPITPLPTTSTSGRRLSCTGTPGRRATRSAAVSSPSHTVARATTPSCASRTGQATPSAAGATPDQTRPQVPQECALLPRMVMAAIPASHARITGDRTSRSLARAANLRWLVPRPPLSRRPFSLECQQRRRSSRGPSTNSRSASRTSTG